MLAKEHFFQETEKQIASKLFRLLSKAVHNTLTSISKHCLIFGNAST